ncbi:MAG: transposase [Gammaproteobacteria bacterium]|nr:transposase [Gammaproteobacteria bacterium]
MQRPLTLDKSRWNCYLEMRLKIDMARDHGRATPGERVVDTKPSTRGENLSVIGALGYDGILATMNLPGAVDGEAYLIFTKEVLAPI